MEYYITAMRDAAEKCDPKDLKDVFDFLMEQAKDDYKAGALDVLEYGNIINEYTDTLMTRNVVNYL